MRNAVALAMLTAAFGSAQAQISQPPSSSKGLWEEHKVLLCTIQGFANPMQLDLENAKLCFVDALGKCRPGTEISLGTVNRAQDGGIWARFKTEEGKTLYLYMSKSGDRLRLRDESLPPGTPDEKAITEGSCKAKS